MKKELDFKFIRPFGPMISKVSIPEEIINERIRTNNRSLCDSGKYKEKSETFKS